MTDLTPNDLSDLSDKEFNSLAPQGYHATGSVEPLSLAAQQIVNSAIEAGGGYGRATPLLHARVAAILRAVAEYVVLPKYQFVNWGMAHAIHQELISIADELDQQSS
jgi:hypothetical protein